MTASPQSLNPAAVLEITKPNAAMGYARAAIAGAAAGDLAGQRELRDAYMGGARDTARPLAYLVSAAECAVLMARLAASYGEIDDVLCLAESLIRASDLLALCSQTASSEARLVEGIGLYQRIAATGHADADRTYQALSVSIPAVLMERVMQEAVRIAAGHDDDSVTENKRVH